MSHKKGPCDPRRPLSRGRSVTKEIKPHQRTLWNCDQVRGREEKIRNGALSSLEEMNLSAHIQRCRPCQNLVALWRDNPTPPDSAA